MSNHFHVLVRVPQQHAIGDEELLRRYAVLYPKPTPYQQARLDEVRKQLGSGGAMAEAWRARQLALMGDVSQFMKLLKQRFSVWFNRTHNRFGPLWSDRFKSVLVEGKRGALTTMAAYIDLNPVRAGLVDDPKDYRFCGYAEAVAGNTFVQRGLRSIVGGRMADALSLYRQLLFGKGSAAKAGAAHLSEADLQTVVRQRGRLPKAQVLRCRIRHFSDGAVLGSRAFVQEQLTRFQRITGRRKRMRPRELPGVTDWDGLMTMRGLRQRAFG
jgi:REP element-mobilizing transposase RayT